MVLQAFGGIQRISGLGCFRNDDGANRAQYAERHPVGSLCPSNHIVMRRSMSIRAAFVPFGIFLQHRTPALLNMCRSRREAHLLSFGEKAKKRAVFHNDPASLCSGRRGFSRAAFQCGDRILGRCVQKCIVPLRTTRNSLPQRVSPL